MGYLGRRIGLSQDKAGPSSPTGADGAVGGGVLDLIASGYFQRQGNVYNAPMPDAPSGMTATGGIVHDYSTTPGDIYRAHIFTASGTFEVTAPGDFDDSLEYLVVAGGGGGGGYSGANGGGGGGAGGLRTNLSGHPKAGAAYPVPAFPTSYTVVIGGGGNYQPSPAPGTDGANSEFYPTPQSYPSTARIRSVGGGGGGYNPAAGRPGGSSGGGAAPTSSIVPGNASPDPNHPEPAGNAGGHGASNNSRAGGGGGGAGSDGGNASGSFPGGLAGYGGKALQVAIAGPPTLSAAGTPGETGQGWYAGGGGGAGADETFPDSKRGIGGRGNDRTGTTPWGGGGNGAPGGSPAVPRAQMDGLAATGGGGGGGREANNPGGNGGSGIVVVRYKIGSVSSQKATGGAISFYNGKTIHAFTQTGDFNNTTGADLTGCEVVILGGGGGGGMWQAGGGGAGRFYRNDDVTVSPGPNTVTIGAGGAGANSASSGGAEGTKGASSVFNSVTMIGGGGGAKYNGDAANPGPGGSGGGGAGGPGNAQSATPSDVTAVTNQDTPPVGAGNPGANGQTPAPHGGGGGGGAGGTATAGSSGNGGPGGLGIQLPSTFRDPVSTIGYASGDPSASYFVGGGGGGSAGPPAAKLGGGGGGAPQVPQPNQAADGSVPIANRSTYQWAGAGFGVADASNLVAPSAMANSGSGGGGCGDGYPRDGRYGGNGGSGLVLIAYPT